jgi:hypothetical protein
VARSRFTKGWLLAHLLKLYVFVIYFNMFMCFDSGSTKITRYEVASQIVPG